MKASEIIKVLSIPSSFVIILIYSYFCSHLWNLLENFSWKKFLSTERSNKTYSWMNSVIYNSISIMSCPQILTVNIFCKFKSEITDSYAQSYPKPFNMKLHQLWIWLTFRQYKVIHHNCIIIKSTRWSQWQITQHDFRTLYVKLSSIRQICLSPVNHEKCLR